MSLASPNFDTYRQEFIVRNPDISRQNFPDELDDLTSNADFFPLSVAPSAIFDVGKPADRMAASQNMYLWLVTPVSVVTVVEEGVSGKATLRKRLAHTNLSGGAPAHCGGELWYRDGSSLWLTGGSSRYAPRSAAELQSLVMAFTRSGYSVCCCGWDDELAGPARFFRGPEKWVNPNE